MQEREDERHEDTKDEALEQRDFKAACMRDAAITVVDTCDGKSCGECRECDKARDLRRI